jgi:uroporphyrinogen-III synthase
MLNSEFRSLRVLALESRFSEEISRLILSFGGRPHVAPALEEVKLESNHGALSFAVGLLDGQFDMVIFLTGAGVRR